MLSRNPSDHKVSDIRARVWEAAEAATKALSAFDAPIQQLAIQQLVVNSQIRAVAMEQLTRARPSEDSRIQSMGPYTIAEVAERCHVSLDAVRKWLGSGALKKTKAGGRTLVTEENLQLFLKESTDKPKTERNGKAA